MDIALFEHRKKLDETTMELKKTSKALEAEKRKTEELLYEMMPKKIAEQLLTRGQVVKAGESDLYGQVLVKQFHVVTWPSAVESASNGQMSKAGKSVSTGPMIKTGESDTNFQVVHAAGLESQ